MRLSIRVKSNMLMVKVRCRVDVYSEFVCKCRVSHHRLKSVVLVIVQLVQETVAIALAEKLFTRSEIAGS